MLRRHPSTAFGSVHVFPGGVVDGTDTDPGLDGRCPDLTDAEASARLRVPTGGRAFWVAAARECFEEAGVLLARHASGEPLRLDHHPAVQRRFEEHRRAVHAGTRSLLEVLRAEALVLALGEVRYLSRWITPTGQPKRFDARFFVGPGARGPRLRPRRPRADRQRLGPAERRARPPLAGRVRPDRADDPQPGGRRPLHERRRAARVGPPHPSARGPPGMTTEPAGEADAAGAQAARPRRGQRLEPARAAHRGQQPGAHDRTGHQHLPGRDRRDRGHRPGPGRRRPPRRRRGLRWRPDPLDPLHPHPPRPLPRGRRDCGSAPAPRCWPSMPATGWRSTGRCGEGDKVEATEFVLRALHTPGHASNHLCFLLEQERMLFSGDHIMQGSTVVIRPPDGDMAAYLGPARAAQGASSPAALDRPRPRPPHRGADRQDRRVPRAPGDA